MTVTFEKIRDCFESFPESSEAVNYTLFLPVLPAKEILYYTVLFTVPVVVSASDMVAVRQVTTGTSCFLVSAAYSVLMSTIVSLPPVSSRNSSNMSSTSIPSVEFVTLVFENASDVTSFAFMKPVVMLAMEHLNKAYGARVNFRNKFLLKPNVTTCDALKDESSFMISQYVLQPREAANVTATISWGCDDAVLLNQLSREWNQLFITRVMINRQLSPTWITTTPTDMANFLHLYMTLFIRYGWSSIFIIVDGFAVNAQILFTAVSEALFMVLNNAPLFKVKKVILESKPNRTFPLPQFRNVSRVCVYLGNGGLMHDLLLQAAEQNMTNGDYVFIALEVFPDPLFGSYSWQYYDAYDNISREAYQSVIRLGMLPSQAAHVQVATVSPTGLYDVHDPNFIKANPFISSLYASYVIAGTVLSETIDMGNSSDIHDGKAIATRFLKRSFITEVGRIYICETGQRRVDLAISNLNNFTGDFEVRIVQRGETWDWETLSLIQWRGGRPPVNEPECGYLNDNIKCQKIGIFNTGLAVGTGVVSFLIFATICSVGVYLNQLNVADTWWKLQVEFLKRSASSRISALSRDLIGSVLRARFSISSKGSRRVLWKK